MSKTKLCYVAFVYDTELKSTAESSDKNQTYMLSDGNVGTVGAERFRCPSVLPARFIGTEKPVESSTLLSTNFMTCDVATRKEMYATVVLSVGTTCSKGIVERMMKSKREVRRLHPQRSVRHCRAVRWHDHVPRD